MGMPASLAASRSFRISETGPSRSQASGDSGSVKPRVMSMITRAGRRPKPPRSPNPCMCAKALASVGPGLAELTREPLVELAAGRGDHAPLLFERRQIPVVEVRRLGAVTSYVLTFRVCRLRVDGAVRENHAVEALGGFWAYEAPAHVFGHGLGVALQGVTDASRAGGLEDEAVALEDGHVAHLGRQVDLFAVGPDEGLLRRCTRLAAVDAVGEGVVAVVLI